MLAGSYDAVCWLGARRLTSVLLVGFFQSAPDQCGRRCVLVTYRLCDVGLLIAPILLHLSIHSGGFVDIQGAMTVPSDRHAVPATVAALFLLIAAMGKSAQFPVGGWLPRAMEGPTASSAVFYGGLSVHVGVYLLIRSAPLFDQAPLAVAADCHRWRDGGDGGAVRSGQRRCQVRSGLRHATISQVGLMFVECGFGLYRLATVHLIAHAVLRYYQFLRIPSVLQDALRKRAALGTQPRAGAEEPHRSADAADSHRALSPGDRAPSRGRSRSLHRPPGPTSPRTGWASWRRASPPAWPAAPATVFPATAATAATAREGPR